MDQIILKGLRFYGYHGVLEAEHQIGQKFNVEAVLTCDLKQAGMTDDLTQTVNYAAVYQCIETIVTKTRFKLIEALAETLASEILALDRKIQKVSITVEKPEAPVPGIFDSFAVRIERARG